METRESSLDSSSTVYEEAKKDAESRIDSYRRQIDRLLSSARSTILSSTPVKRDVGLMSAPTICFETPDNHYHHHQLTRNNNSSGISSSSRRSRSFDEADSDDDVGVGVVDDDMDERFDRDAVLSCGRALDAVEDQYQSPSFRSGLFAMLRGDGKLRARKKRSTYVGGGVSGVGWALITGLTIAIGLISVRVMMKSAVTSSSGILNALFDELGMRHGRVACENLPDDRKYMNMDELRLFLDKRRLISYKDTDALRSLVLMLQKNPKWHMFVLDRSRNPIESEHRIDEAAYVYTDLAMRSFLCRVRTGVTRLGIKAVRLTAFVLFVIAALLMVYALINRRKRYDDDVYELLSEINKVMIRHKKAYEAKEQPLPFIAVMNVHDVVLYGGADFRRFPRAKQSYKEQVWLKAEQIVRQTEPRIREETQIIDGEEYLVWRWVGLV